VGIAQLIALTADESILCMRRNDVALLKLLWDFLLLLFLNPQVGSKKFLQNNYDEVAFILTGHLSQNH